MKFIDRVVLQSLPTNLVIALSFALSIQRCEGSCSQSTSGQEWLERGLTLDQSTTDDKAKLLQARDAFQKACDRHVLEGCYNLGVFYWGRVGLLQERNLSRAEVLLQSNCDHGHLKSCAALGDLIINRDYNSAAALRNIRLQRKACEGGELRGCANLAFAIGSGYGTPFNLTTEAELLEKSCRGGDYYGCAFLGLGHEQPSRTETVESLLRGECKMGESSACRGLGLLTLLGGFGIARDPKAAGDLFQAACGDRGQDLGACANLGYIVEHGLIDGKPDKTKAESLYRESCDNLTGDPLGCALLCKLDAGQDDANRSVLCRETCARGYVDACRE
jgi:TPR repeat protein